MCIGHIDKDAESAGFTGIGKTLEESARLQRIQQDFRGIGKTSEELAKLQIRIKESASGFWNRQEDSGIGHY